MKMKMKLISYKKEPIQLGRDNTMLFYDESKLPRYGKSLRDRRDN